MGGSTLSSGKSGGGAGMQATKRQKGWLEGGQKIESLKALRAKQKHLSATIPMHGALRLPTTGPPLGSLVTTSISESTRMLYACVSDALLYSQ